MKKNISSPDQGLDLQSIYLTAIKSFFTAFLLFCSLGVYGQTTIFSENMGTPSATITIAANAFQNSSPIAYSGTGDVRNTSTSSGYTGSSGGGNILLTNATFVVSGISTVNYSGLSLSFGAFKSTLASTMSELKLEYSTDGTNYTVVAIPAQAAGSGTAIWRLVSSISLPAAAENVPNLHLKWTNTSSTPQFRLDDVVLKGTAPTGFNVTYNGNTNTSGSVPTDNTNYTSGATVTISGNTGTLAKTNYNFTGWNTLEDGRGADRAAASTFIISANTALYAKWTGNITYNANGGSGTTIDATDYLAGASVTTTTNGFTYAGFTFVGWNTQADGLGTNYTVSQANAFSFAGNTTLYAKWTSSFTITFVNLQSPGTKTINEGETFDVYGQVYAAGLTEAAEAGAGIIAEVGYSSTDNDPINTGWTWSSANFNVQVGNNDEYKGTLGSGITPGTYYYATRFKIGSSGTWLYGGYKNNSPSTTNGGIWNGTANISGVLTDVADVIDFGNFQFPATGNIVIGQNHNVYGQVYEPGITPGSGQGAGITAEVGYNLANNTNPNTWTNWLTTNFNPGVTGNNDEYTRNIGPVLSTEGTYYLAFRYKKMGSSTYIYGGTNGIWSNDSATLTVISPATITSGLVKSTVYGAADSYFITATGTAPVTYNATGLPAGLSVSTTTGVISGTVTGNVAIYNVAISATNSGGTSTKTLVWTITKKPLKITGVTAANKIYDSTTSATLSGIPDLNTIESGDAVIVVGTPTASFATKIVGTAKVVTVTGYTLTGAKAGNYTVSQPTGLTADITARALTVSGATAENKVYDGTTTATIVGAALVGVISPDTVSISVGGTFADVNAAIGKAVTSNFTLSGADAGNYTVTQPTGLKADITQATPVFTTSPINVAVGGTIALPGAISSTSNGVLSYTISDIGNATLSGTTITGVSVGSETLTVNQASSLNYIAESTTVAVTVNTFGDGEFRTLTNGQWRTSPTAAAASWEIFDSVTGWGPISTQPPLNTTKNVYIEHEITLVSTTNAKNIIVGSSGILNTSTVTANFKNVLVKKGGVLNKQGNAVKFDSDGTFEVLDGGTFTYKHTNNDSPRIDNIWNGDEKFHPNSKFIILQTDIGAGNLVVEDISKISKFNNALFGNVIIDMSAGKLPLFPAVFNATLAAGDLIFKKGSSNAKIFDGIYNATVKGNLIIEPTYYKRIIFLNGAGPATLTVEGNVNHEGTAALNLSTAAGTSSLNIGGNLSLGASAALEATSTLSSINFIGSGTLLNPQTINVVKQTTASNIVFNVNAGTYVQLINQNLSLGTNSTFNVSSNSTLDFGYNGSLALNLVSNGTGQNFTAASGSTLKITSPDGLTTAETSAVGNVQIPTRTFSAGATYHYIGKSFTPQVTGNAVAGTSNHLKGKIIVDMESALGQFSASGTDTIDAGGILDIRTGVVSDDSTNGFNGAGDLLMTSANGRYITSKTGTQPDLRGNYTLTNGTIEFANTSSTASIRVTPRYFNVDISGTNITSGGKDFVVNKLLKVTKSNAVLTIPSTTDIDTPNVLTAKKGIQVVAGGKALFLNNANLIQDIDAVNYGNITMQRKATVPSNQYNYWTSPVAGQPLYGLYDVPDNTVMTYNAYNDRFTVLPKASNPLSSFAKGYSIAGSPSAASLIAEFVGVPNNETSAGVNSIALSTAGNNYNLIGNPYPSNLDLVALYADSDNTNKFYNVTTGADIETPTAYFWDNTSNTDTSQQGSTYVNQNYAILNLASGLGTSAPRFVTLGKKPNGIVKPGQGFIIRAAESAGSLIFKNVFRTTSVGTIGTYFKNNSPTLDKYWLTLTTPNNINIEIALAYNSEAENSFELFDSAIFSDTVSENFYSLSSDLKKLAIQSRKGNFTLKDNISLGIKTFSTGIQKISINQKEGIFDGSQSIYLKDNLLNTTTNITERDYEFIASKGTDQNRFEIVYEPEGFLATANTDKSALQVYRDMSVFVIKSSGIKITKVEVYDSSGRLVLIQSSNTTEVRLNTENFASGAYLLKIYQDQSVVNKKIIKY